MPGADGRNTVAGFGLCVSGRVAQDGGEEHLRGSGGASLTRNGRHAVSRKGRALRLDTGDRETGRRLARHAAVVLTALAAAGRQFRIGIVRKNGGLNHEEAEERQ